jgi:hypothetical protein
MESNFESLRNESLFDALRGRRSRRFGAGMKIPSGPFAYESRLPPQPLCETEEAALVFAAAGITGHALADLSYGAQEGGTMVAGLAGRTVSSADAIQSTALVVTRDDATYLLRRPQELAAGEVAEFAALVERGALVEAYRRGRVTLRDARCAPTLEPPVNFSVNKWSLYAEGGTYFLPINDVTRFYINGVMEMFDEGMDLFLVDERAGFRPAGLARFGRKRGGRLHDDPRDRKMGTIAQTETVIAEMIAVELGMMLQNLHLMAQAIGLGAWPNFARHESAWFEALGFRMQSMPGTRYVGAPRWLRGMTKLLGRDVEAQYPIGLELDGEVLLRPYAPPYFRSMREAVYAVAEEKFGASGTFRGGARDSAWKDPVGAAQKIERPHDSVIDATAAYCEYIYRTYGRFPAYLAPFRTLLGSQVTHLDLEFYERYFRPEAVTDSQRRHQERWHGGNGGAS